MFKDFISRRSGWRRQRNITVSLAAVVKNQGINLWGCWFVSLGCGLMTEGRWQFWKIYSRWLGEVHWRWQVEVLNNESKGGWSWDQVLEILDRIFFLSSISLHFCTALRFKNTENLVRAGRTDTDNGHNHNQSPGDSRQYLKYL